MTKKITRVDHDAALKRAVTSLMADHTELFKQFADNPEFGKWLADSVFQATYKGPGTGASPGPVKAMN